MSDRTVSTESQSIDPDVPAETTVTTPTGESAIPAVAVPASSSSDPAQFGRIDEDGNVWVKESTGERRVGSYPDGVPDNALDLYTRRFLDLEATINLFETRLPSLSAKDIEATLVTLEESVKEPAAVGDLDALRARVAKLRVLGDERKESARAERQAARAQALAERTRVVERAEALAAQDPERTQWKQSSQQLRDLLDEWKSLQRRGPRLDRSDEDGLWKRFSSARTTFDRHRRQFFSALDAKQTEVRRIKEKLIAEAESMQNSTDWARTASAYRALMDEWKAAGRASRKEDDALWARFRAAQQVFFDARRANTETVEAELHENLRIKTQLLEEAEALLPVTDLAATQRALRDIQERWEDTGRVPRHDVARIETRMRAVENAVKEAEDAEWRRTDPQTKARAEGMLGQLQASIEQLESELEQARSAHDEDAVRALSDALETKRSWYNQIAGSVD